MSEKPKLFWFMGQPPLITSTLFFTVLIVCFGSSLLFGYSMAILNNLEHEFICFMNPVFCGANVSNVDLLKGKWYYAGLTSSYIVLAAVGAFASGFISNYFGRKKSLFYNNFIAVLGGLIVLITFGVHSIATVFISRIIYGLNAGLTSGIAPTYMAEITPTEIRGAIMACHQLSVTLGITIAYILTLKSIFNQAKKWIIALAMPLIPAIVSIIILPFCPESPRYLFINLNQEEAAKTAFDKFNKVQDASVQLAEIKEEVDAINLLPTFRIVDLFKSKAYRLATIISVVLNVMQQFSGINAVIGYSRNMFTDAKVDDAQIEYCVVAIGVLNMCSTIPSILLMEISGRRPLLIFPSLLSIFSLIGSFLMVGVLPKISPTNIKIFAIISLVFICLFIVGFALGMGPIPGIVVAEMFTQAPRAAAYSLALGIQWISAFIILFLYPVVNAAIAPGYVFLFFVVISSVCLAYLIIFMPETKNRSFTDIALKLSGNKVEDTA